MSRLLTLTTAPVQLWWKPSVTEDPVDRGFKKLVSKYNHF